MKDEIHLEWNRVLIETDHRMFLLDRVNLLIEICRYNQWVVFDHCSNEQREWMEFDPLIDRIHHRNHFDFLLRTWWYVRIDTEKFVLLQSHWCFASFQCAFVLYSFNDNEKKKFFINNFENKFSNFSSKKISVRIFCSSKNFQGGQSIFRRVEVNQTTNSIVSPRISNLMRLIFM